MKMLVTKSRDKIKLNGQNQEQPFNLETVMEACTSVGEKGMTPPITITHTEDNGARLKETKSLNKLPFKNRNPAL